MGDSAAIKPVAKRDRIEVIDILRGVAILGILHLNMPYNVGDEYLPILFPESFGATGADHYVRVFMDIFTSGTFRAMLEILFAAGLMMMTARAMTPDGPVGVADVWFRRNLWLMGFALFNWIVLSYFGDVLFTYAAAAILLFPFRKLSVRWLLVIVAGFLLWTGVDRYRSHIERLEDRATVAEARQTLADGGMVDETATELLEEQEKRDRRELPEKFQERVDKSEELQQSGIAYLTTGYTQFLWIWGDGTLFRWARLSFFAMLFGLVLYKVGFTQGAIASKAYLAIAIGGYGVGWTLRYFDLQFGLAEQPSPYFIFSEVPRMMLAMAHISALHLLYRSGLGGLLVRTLGQVGRVAFSVYLMQSFIMIYIMAAPWGLDLSGKLTWSSSLIYSAIIMALQIPLAMWWLKHFRFGPLEWAWRSLTHWQVQPMRLDREAEGKPPCGPQPTAA